MSVNDGDETAPAVQPPDCQPGLAPDERSSVYGKDPGANEVVVVLTSEVGEAVAKTVGPVPGGSQKEKKKLRAKERNRILAEEKTRIADEKNRVTEERKAITDELHSSDTIPVEDFPLGYPRQAAFVSSKPTLSIYRAFNYLHARVILELQDELRCLEQDLADLDAEYFYSSDPRQNARVTSRDADMLEARRESKKAENQGNGALPGALNYEQSSVPLTKRAALLVAIRLKLVEYDEMLVKVRELSEFKRPSRRDYLTFRTWFWNIKPLSYEAEEEYIRKEGDLITTLSPRAEWGSLDGWIEELIPKLPHLARRVFRDTDPRGATRDPFVSYYSISRIEKLTTLVISFVIIILLAVPVFIMYRVSWEGGRSMTLLNVGLLIIFSLFFSVSMSLMTKARRAELFAATAAYSAVLIVFISNFSGSDAGATIT